ncbi:hypothetical protein A7E78_11645 [Syntrophotalea acetylenivorans]|uniref:NodB homology domain-containing protein n=1 Tax=Syntrophotalea acetylenivorans TaxID=1842532 RepID=A0A1L3GRA8_9BACT|nr:polysaccharide deacetylase family protein [Syntrophotalea acetylenivorans]APG28443.1 hypothetical protein A7E78_11645 [Syntrophotalea acetylenivorans]
MSIKTRLTLELAKRVLPKERFAVNLRERKVSKNAAPVYLTFDDGPHPDFTPRLLDEITKLKAKATFFVLGKRAQLYPNLVRRILAEGHSVGTHTWSHWSARKVSVATWIKDVQCARHEVEDITGKPCKLFRPPYGELTPLSLLALMREGIRTIHWSQDTKDFACTSKSKFCQWFADNTPTPGTIVLMHDLTALTHENLLEGCSHWQENTEFLSIPE